MKNKGFTLIARLIVFPIIALVLAIFVPSLNIVKKGGGFV
jgi:competence protein ComGC